MADKLLTIPEVADLIGVKRMTVYRLIHAKQIKTVNISGGPKRVKLRIRESAYEAFVKARTV